MAPRDRIINALKGAGFTPADCEDAAEALEAIGVTIRAASTKVKRNVRRGDRSRAYAGVLLPKFQKQNCGHSFNSSGCAVCIRCLEEKQARKPLICITEGPYTPAVIRRRDLMLLGAQ
jgi:hypothetical protein